MFLLYLLLLYLFIINCLYCKPTKLFDSINKNSTECANQTKKVDFVNICFAKTFLSWFAYITTSNLHYKYFWAPIKTSIELHVVDRTYLFLTYYVKTDYWRVSRIYFHILFSIN